MAITARLDGRRYKAVITVTAGTPIFVASAKLLANKVLIQMLHGGAAMGYVYNDVPNGTLAANVAAMGNPVELAAASADGPGGTYTDTGSIDLSMIAVDGVNTGDKILVDANLVI